MTSLGEGFLQGSLFAVPHNVVHHDATNGQMVFKSHQLWEASDNEDWGGVVLDQGGQQLYNFLTEDDDAERCKTWTDGQQALLNAYHKYTHLLSERRVASYQRRKDAFLSQLETMSYFKDALHEQWDGVWHDEIDQLNESIRRLSIEYYAALERKKLLAERAMREENMKLMKLRNLASSSMYFNLFSIHIEQETEGDIRLSRLSPTSSLFIRCKTAASDVIRPQFFEGTPYHGINVIDVYKIENKALVARFDSHNEGQGSVKGLFTPISTNCLERALVYGFRSSRARNSFFDRILEEEKTEGDSKGGKGDESSPEHRASLRPDFTSPSQSRKGDCFRADLLATLNAEERESHDSLFFHRWQLGWNKKLSHVENLLYDGRAPECPAPFSRFSTFEEPVKKGKKTVHHLLLCRVLVTEDDPYDAASETFTIAEGAAILPEFLLQYEFLPNTPEEEVSLFGSSTTEEKAIGELASVHESFHLRLLSQQERTVRQVHHTRRQLSVHLSNSLEENQAYLQAMKRITEDLQKWVKTVGQVVPTLPLATSWASLQALQRLRDNSNSNATPRVSSARSLASRDDKDSQEKEKDKDKERRKLPHSKSAPSGAAVSGKRGVKAIRSLRPNRG
jgi:hypothetical protein